MPAVLSGFSVTPGETTIAVSLGVSGVPGIKPLVFYYVAVPTGDEPSDEQIADGLQSDGTTPALLAFDQTILAEDDDTEPVTTPGQALADGTFDFYCVAKGSDDEFSNVVSDTGVVIGGTDASVTTDVGAATAEGQAPTASAGSGASVTTDVGTADAEGQALDASAGSEATTDVGAATAEGVEADASAGSSATSDVGEATAEGIAPEATAGGGGPTYTVLFTDDADQTADNITGSGNDPNYWGSLTNNGWIQYDGAGAIVGPSSSAYSAIIANGPDAPAQPADQYIEFTINSFGGEWRHLLRIAGEPTYIYSITTATGSEIFKRVANVSTSLDTVTETWSLPARFRLEVVGNDVKFFVDDVEKMSGNTGGDVSAANPVGIALDNSNGSTIDDVEVGSIT